MNARTGLLLALALAFALTGCAGSLLESKAEAPATYRLAGEALPDRGERLPAALGVARPRAAPALDTDRVAVLQPDSREQVEVRVCDHGPGIAEEDAERVFDRFYRSARARGRPGSGLGLAIVRQVADTHGGTASVESAAGGGARFRIDLPVEELSATS